MKDRAKMWTKLALAAACVLAMASYSAAQTNIDLGGLTVDTAAQIEVSADSLSIDQETGIAVFDGSVIVAQGPLRITAGRVEVVYGDDTTQISKLNASGGVTFVTEDEAAEAESASYEIETGLLTLTGSVLLTQGASAISAERMVINVTTGTAQMDGRVRTILQQGGN